MYDQEKNEGICVFMKKAVLKIQRFQETPL